MNIFFNHQLGEIGEPISIRTAEHHRVAATLMTQQARLYIDIVSRKLDPPVYDTSEFVDSVKRMVLQNKHTKVRILVFEPNAVVRRGHRLLDLATTLSSFFEIRKSGPEHKGWNGSLFIADGVGYVQRYDAGRFEGVANFNDMRQSKLLLQEFEEMWAKSQPDPNFRRVML